MSFTIIFNTNGAPMDMDRQERSEGESVAFGRSRQTALIWSDPGAGLEARDVRHPVDLDGRFFILGRVRLDAREELLATLAATDAETDALLCLRAYAKWGEQCVEHLRGDFCFGIWDETRQLLFCARDQLGVRPLFYARVGYSWLVSDDLDTIALAPGISHDLDGYWIADFLTTGFCLDFERTVYRQINRLPPAHVLSLSAGGHAIRKYWSLNIQEPIYFRDSRQYLEQFRELVSRAIVDRLPEGRVGISLSGGLDSSTLAAQTVQVTGEPSRVVAETRYFAHLIPDEEERFSLLVANSLGIRLTQHAVDDTVYDPAWRSQSQRTPEPSLAINNAEAARMFEAEMMSGANVWFLGEGPDNALTFEWMAYLRWLKNKRDWPRLAGAAFQYLRCKQMREWLSTFYSRTPFRSRGAEGDKLRWLDDRFAKNVDLKKRLSRAFDYSVEPHPWRPVAMASFKHPIWQNYYENHDPATSCTRLDWRHPYADLRVLTFMLSVPPIPWARRKLLIREAMQGRLPQEILARNKTPLSMDPLAVMLDKNPLPPLALSATARRFADPKKLNAKPQGPVERFSLLKVYALDHWLGTHGYH